MLIQFICLQLFFFSNLLAFPQTQEVLDDVFGDDESDYEESYDIESDLESDIFGNFVNCSTLEGFRWVT